MFHTTTEKETYDLILEEAIQRGQKNVWRFGTVDFALEPFVTFCAFLVPGGACMIHGMAMERLTKHEQSVCCTSLIDMLGCSCYNRYQVIKNYHIGWRWWYDYIVCYFLYPCAAVQEYLEVVSRG